MRYDENVPTAKRNKQPPSLKNIFLTPRLPKNDWVLIGLLSVFVVVLAWALAVSPKVMLFGTIIDRVETERKVVALTFDDGPLPVHTDETLRLLAQNNVRATFFVIGKDAETYKDELSAVVRAGHALGNHGYSHRALMFASPARIASEIEMTDQAIRAAGYEDAIPFRAPYGYKFVALPLYLARHDRPDISRDVLVDEGSERSAEAIATDVVAKVKPGSIILLHPHYDHTASTRAAIPLIVNELRTSGYTFVTVPELLSLE